MKELLLTLLVTIYLLPGCQTADESKLTGKQKKVIQTMEQLIRDNNIPGMNVSVIDANGKLENFSKGYADKDKKIKLNADHVLFTGSIGKTFAASVIFQLIDEGKIRLDDKIVNYFPDIDWFKFFPNINDITIEMLLNHTSGLSRYTMKLNVWDSVKVNPDKVWSYKDRLSIIFNDSPQHKAGKGWAYSDTNYILLAMLIEKVTGNGYYEAIRQRILIPQKLKDTHPAIRRDLPNLSNGYTGIPEVFHYSGEVAPDGIYYFNPQMEWAGGGIASTTPDLARWAKLYFEGKIFSQVMLKKMITPSESGADIGDGVDCGMGSFIYQTRHGVIHAHTGMMPGFNSIFAYIPKYKLAVALQMNCDYARKEISLIEYLSKIIDVYVI